MLSKTQAGNLIQAQYAASMRSNNPKEALDMLERLGDILAKNSEFIVSGSNLLHKGLAIIEQQAPAPGSALTHYGDVGKL